jgi:hypothetical protein
MTRVQSPAEEATFLFATLSKAALFLTQAPIQGVELSEGEADFSPPPGTVVKIRGALPHTLRLHGAFYRP